jgi:hypothetical protein
MIDDKIRQVIDEFDATHPSWGQERREHEIREAEETSARAQRARETRRQAEQQTAANAQVWCDWVDTRIDQRIDIDGLSDALGDALGQVVAEECTEERKITKAAIAEAEAKFDAKLAALEQRLKAVPGKLPCVKDYAADHVHYEANLVTHAGALWQARCDTVHAPPHGDWACLARAGRDGSDGRSPKVRGTYDAHASYERLDVVALDGAAFIARRDNPGLCPGDGWQLLSRQGRPGRKGERGDPGPRGMPGEPGARFVNSKIDENYNLTILRADNSLEIIPLREAFERYHRETSE